MITNPNRFIRGLSDLSDIADGNYDVGFPQVTTAPTNPVGVVVPPTTGNTGGSGSNSSFSLVEAEFTLTQDGGQNLTLQDSVGSAVFMCVNGLVQSKTAYSFTGTTLILPSSLNLYTGDIITFVYST